VADSGRILAEAEAMDRAEKGVSTLAQSYHSLMIELERAKAAFAASGGTSGEAARSLLKVGTEAEGSRHKLNEYVSTMELMERRGIELTDSQRQLLQTAREMSAQFEGTSKGINQQAQELKRVVTASD